jgi:FkbM family methyltransferase
MGRAMGTSTKNDVVATYHGVEVLSAPHLGPNMIINMGLGKYERREVLSALKFIEEGDVVVEMGAGAGLVGAAVAKNCAPEKIVSFEANHKLISSINALYEHNGIADIIEVHNQIVISDPEAPQAVDFFIRGNFLGSGMTITKGMERAEKVSAPVVAWATIKEQFKPTVLLMDIEGAELEFFRHADLGGIRVIIAELHRHIYHRPGMREIREGIAAKGFIEDREASGGGVFVFTAV